MSIALGQWLLEHDQDQHMQEKPTAGMKEWLIYTGVYLEWPTKKRSWKSPQKPTWMNDKFRHVFILKTDTIALETKQNNKI